MRWKHVFIAVALGALVGIGTAAQAHIDEPKPRGYGQDPCATVTYDMATSPAVFDAWHWQQHTNLFSCGQRADGSWHYVKHKYDRGCGVLAYKVAKSYVKRGYSSLSITPGMIGRALDRLDHARDCALDGRTWLWS
jgi:hypothetical protein